MKIPIILFTLLWSNSLFSQKMFENQETVCPLKFTLEDDEKIINYHPNDSLLVVDFLKGLDEKQLDKLKGEIYLQVMVDTLGRVCCVSYANKSNLLDKKLAIPDRILQMPGWNRVPGVFTDQNMCTLIQLVFNPNTVTLNRIGYNRNTGRRPLETLQYFRKQNPIVEDSNTKEKDGIN